MRACWDLGEQLAHLAPATPPDSSTVLHSGLWQAPLRVFNRDLDSLWPDEAAGEAGGSPPRQLAAQGWWQRPAPYAVSCFARCSDSEETLVMPGAPDVASLVDVDTGSRRVAGSAAARFAKGRRTGHKTNTRPSPTSQQRWARRESRPAKVGAVGVKAARGAVKGARAKATVTTEAKVKAKAKGQARDQARAHTTKVFKRPADAHSSDADSERSWPRAGRPRGK